MPSCHGPTPPRIHVDVPLLHRYPLTVHEQFPAPPDDKKRSRRQWNGNVAPAVNPLRMVLSWTCDLGESENRIHIYAGFCPGNWRFGVVLVQVEQNRLLWFGINEPLGNYLGQTRGPAARSANMARQSSFLHVVSPFETCVTRQQEPGAAMHPSANAHVCPRGKTAYE